MDYREIKELLNTLNNENCEELKGKIIRKVNELILNINDETFSDSELEKICNFYLCREKFRKDVRENGKDVLSEGVLIEDFIKAFDEFINVLQDKGYNSDAIELINYSLRSIGDIARGYRLVRKYANREDYESIEYLQDAKSEFYKQLRAYSVKGIYEELFVISGLIQVIKFDLEEKSQEHGRNVISILTDYKTKRTKRIQEFESEMHLKELKIKVKREYGIELQRRIYMWNELTMKLQDHYYLEALYEESDKDN